MFEQFPYANFHEMNMDWVIKVVKDFLAKYTDIENLIARGQEDITELTDEKLQELEDKTTELENLLQEWYETHEASLTETLNQKLAEVLASIPADYSALAATVNGILSANVYRVTSTTPAVNYNRPVNANDEYVFRLAALSDASKKITLYGVYNDGTEHTDAIAQIDKNIKTVKFSRSYNFLRFSVTPYAASWTGSFAIDVLSANSDLYTAIQRIANLENANVLEITSTDPIYYFSKPVTTGNIIYFQLRNISDDKRITVYGMTGSTPTALLSLDGSIQRLYIKTNYDSLQFAISPYDASWVGSYTIDMAIDNMIADVLASSFTPFTYANTAVINTLIKAEEGDNVLFEVTDVTGTDNKLRLYGIYHEGSTERADPLITAYNKNVIYIHECDKTYEYIRVTFSPYISSFTGSFTFNIKIEKNENGLNKAYHDISKTQQGLMKTELYNNLPKVFKKVVCCGDSYTAGHIQLPGQTADPYNEEFAWPHFMSTKTGNNWINCGSSGASTWTWLERDAGLHKAQEQGHAQAYVVGLMINDQSTGATNIPLGTPADIGTENRTYYAGLSKIIRELNAISPLAKIFVNTCPKHGENYDSYNEAVRTVVSTYAETYPVFLIDLEKDYFDLYQIPSLTMDYTNGHYTAVGYEQFADIYNWILSDYMSKNISSFQNVYKIPYDNA